MTPPVGIRGESCTKSRGSQRQISVGSYGKVGNKSATSRQQVGNKLATPGNSVRYSESKLSVNSYVKRNAEGGISARKEIGNKGGTSYKLVAEKLPRSCFVGRMFCLRRCQ